MGSAMIWWRFVSCVAVTLTLSLFVNNVETARNGWSFIPTRSLNETPDRALLFEQSGGPEVWPNIVSNVGASETVFLKGTAYSRPSCISTADDTIECFYRGEDDSVIQQSIVSGKALEPVSIGGETYGNVQCITPTRTSVACFTRGKQNYVSFATRTGSEWSEWNSNTEAKVSEIGHRSCTPRWNGRCNCLFRVEKDQIARFVFKDGKLSLFEDSTTEGKTFHSAFSCTILPRNSLECFGMDFENALVNYNRKKSTGKGQTEVSEYDVNVLTNKYLFSHPSIATVPKRAFLHVFGIAEENKPVHIMYNQTHGFQTDSVVIGSRAMVESPECIATSPKIVYCFALSSNSALYVAKFDGETWNEWSLISSSFLENPSCVLWSDGKKISCFLRSFQRSLVKLDISTSDTSSST